ncbi:MAG: leucine-rich repeat protein [Clostridia bacterium]|nr:leucine-rich repeat protein [Clostridia bacterium]
MKLSEKIVFLRKRNGMSQEELANELGVSRQAIYKWENDITSPEIEKIRVLSELFSVTFDDLLNDNIDLSNPSVISTNTDDSISEVAPATIPPKKPRLPLIISLCVVALCTIVVFIVGISLIVSSLNKEHTHDFGEYIEVAEPSCTKAGAQKRVCKSCGEEETKPIPMVPHSKITIERKEPTCVSVGFTEWEKCSICQTVLKEAVEIAIIPTNHIEQEIKGTAPTCTKTGLTGGVKCQLCDAILKEQTVIPISKDNHISETIKGYDATCVEDGLTDGIKCSECNSILQAQERIPAKGHTDVVVQGCAPTCISVGYKDGLQCSVCGTITLELEEIPIDPSAHEIEILSRVEPTCLTDGLTEGEKCSICKKTLTPQVVIPSNGTHTTITLEGIEATCTENGLTEGKKCSVCEEILVEQEEILATGHTEITLTGKDATCTEDGLTEGKKCSVCEEILVEQKEILPAGHTEQAINGKASTCIENGVSNGAECSVCGAVLLAQNSLPLSSHIVVDEKCTVCGLEANTDLIFTLNEDEVSFSVSLSSTALNLTQLIIPSTYNGLPVTTVVRPEYGESNLKNIYLPDTITRIETCAFIALSKLEYINIPKGTTYIGSDAFTQCTSLTYLYIPNTVTEMERSPFDLCDSDMILYCQLGAETTNWSEWWDVAGGTYNEIKYEVVWVASDPMLGGESEDEEENIEKSGFFIFTLNEDSQSYRVSANPLTLTFDRYIDIPSSYNGKPVTKIADYGFSGNKYITGVHIPSSIKAIGTGAFYNCSNLSKAIIDDGVEEICDGAFSNTSLKTAFIPQSITTLGMGVFDGCSPDGNFKSYLKIYCEAESAQNGWHQYWYMDTYGSHAYSLGSKIHDAYDIFTFTLSDDGQSYSVSAGTEIDIVSYLEIPSTHNSLPVTSILSEGFKGQAGITKAYIPGSIKTIPSLSFEECTNLAEVILGDGVETIESGPFIHCEQITSIYIPKSVSFIEGILILSSTTDIFTTLYIQNGADTSGYQSQWNKYIYEFGDMSIGSYDVFRDLNVVWVDACPESLL